MNKALYLAAGASIAVSSYAGLGASPAHATLCPSNGTMFNENGTCDIVITFKAGGGVTTNVTGKGPYDGSDDQLVGVVNNSGATITGFHLTGTNIGGFDGDGICASRFTLTCNNAADSTGYGGPKATFSNNTGNALDVTFAGGIADGTTQFFSLEAPASINLRVGNIPEPATIAILGASLLGLGA
ncbi:MAG TPA: hypothetical protein VEU47_15485, partial [Candidatus Cybelea sp.]|nr:hypothetical protein [Candidatus Cybelea sp.]